MQYGLVFNKKVIGDGRVIPVVTRENYDLDYSVLSFIGRLDKHDTEGFLHDLNRSINLRGNSDEGFFSDSVEYMEILYQYPNVNIDDILIISMEDMKGLLEEWHSFITS